MTKPRTDQRRFTQEYGQLSPANKAVFKTILELALILLKPQTIPPEHPVQNQKEDIA